MSKLLLEERIQKYFQNKEIARERNEENKALFEEIEGIFEELEEEELIIPLPTGEEAVLTKKANIKEVLDKDALAQELLVAKDEIKTPFDFSMFTAKGKLTPDMISKHTNTETVIKLKLQKRKPRKGRRRKK
ncbi:hypothetical protein LSG31_02130 [Fodinisporobacter ferrooxydans]|uniref:Uncharacterized protein n=1 Tax=Fodinisporobacter ferrooxydans TaxID=2901836 RepID=A0ABY4CKP4_9BACL|nr:hypothetical protein LSG31_02130 [Alicyclobacillaceae bacterium MYW30-H2]